MSDADPARSDSAPLSRRAFVGVCALAGLTGGLAWVHPALFVAAWIWPAALTVALVGARSRWAAFWGCWAANVVAHAVGFDWVAAMTTISIGYAGAAAVAFAIAQYAAFGLVPAAAVALAAAALRRRVPAALWFPPAWLAAEHARFSLLAVSIDDWLATQWQVEPVLRLLGHLGWWPAAALCLAACAAVGEAVVHRRPLHTLPAAALAVVLAALPELPSRGEAHLAGIAALHVVDDVTLPHRAPPGEAVDLIVWPEDALHLRPHLGEGQTRGARVRPLVPGSDAAHLIGLTTQAGHGRQQNQVVVVAPDGAVRGSRAKRLLLPVAERSLFGALGRDLFVPGTAPVPMTIGDRRVGALICGELLDRALVREAADGGADVLVVPARDHMMVSERALRHLLAMQVLRSVEFGLPSVRAAMGGRAVFVTSDGRIVARSPRDRNGFLLWDRAGGVRNIDLRGAPLDESAPARTDRAPADVVVLYSADAPRFRTRCPEGRCRYVALDGFACPADTSAATVVVAGHGRPPRYLSHGVDAIADAVACFDPELVVIDTCYGAAASLFDALAARAPLAGARVVAASTLVPPAGLRYAPDFFTAPTVARRAAAVHSPGVDLTAWSIDPDAIATARARVEAAPDADLAPSITRSDPMQARVPLPDGGTVLVPIPPARAAALRPHVARHIAARARERSRQRRR